MMGDSAEVLDELDFTIDCEDTEYKDFEIINESLENLLVKIDKVGVSQNDVLVFNTITQSECDPYYPINSYTFLPSQTNVEVATENIIKSVFAGIGKIIKFIFAMIRALFRKIGAVFNWLGGGSSKKAADTPSEEPKPSKTEAVKASVKAKSKGVFGKIKSAVSGAAKASEKASRGRGVSNKDQAIVKAIQNNYPEVKTSKFEFENKINDKVVTAQATEKLLMTATGDNDSNKYISVRKIMETFFGGELTDKHWEEIVKGRNSNLKHLINAIINWWNKSHPLVATSSNLVDSFCGDIVKTIDYVLKEVNEGMKWWVEECRRLSKLSKDDYARQGGDFSMEAKKRREELNKNIINLSNKALSTLPFIKAKVNEEINTSLKNAIDEFKVAKVTPKTKIDFAKSLDEIRWVKEISGLQSKIKEGTSQLERNEKELNKIINSMQGIYKDSEITIVKELGHFLKEMQLETQRSSNCVMYLLQFLVLTEQEVENNRSRSARVHELLVTMGVQVEKDLKEETKEIKKEEFKEEEKEEKEES